MVLFLGFSPDMTFELHFWIRLASLIESRVVESEVRMAICETLRRRRSGSGPVGSRCRTLGKRDDVAAPRPGCRGRRARRHASA